MNYDIYREVGEGGILNIYIYFVLPIWKNRGLTSYVLGLQFCFKLEILLNLYKKESSQYFFY